MGHLRNNNTHFAVSCATFGPVFRLCYQKTLLSYTMFSKTLFCSLFALLIGATTISAQATLKYGHLNLGNLLESLPDTKKANEDLKIFTDKLTAKDDSLTKAFQTQYTNFEVEYNKGTLTPVQSQAGQAGLQKMQEDIQKFEQEAQQTVATKREELLKPILTKVNEAVKVVAKENGYAMIFDTSSGSMLFAAEADDVVALVKKKMGL